MLKAFLLITLLTLIYSQNPGSNTPQYHTPISWSNCTSFGKCSIVKGALVIDQNWRWVHYTGSSNGCYSGSWNCGTPQQCTANCQIQGISQTQWTANYGISSTNNGTGVKINYVTRSNIGGRIYLLNGTSNNSIYQSFKLVNRQFAFDVDVSTLQCGINGALYLVEMDADAGMSKFSTNKVGPAYGTGYCDAQCPKGMLFVEGLANTQSYGACCAQLDLWEANKYASVFTTHPCKTTGFLKCSGSTCDTQCQKSGCGINSYQNGNKTFYGPSNSTKKYTLDTSKPFTVVTQFLTTNGKDSGILNNIKRFYVQNGKKIEEPKATLKVLPKFNNINDTNCKIQMKKFGASTVNLNIAQMGKSMTNGMVLALTLWDDWGSSMHWLDSTYPESSSTSIPGVARGPCPTSGGFPTTVRSANPNAYVQYSNIKFGPIGSTY